MAFERVVTDINDESIAFDEKGCFKLYLSATNPGKDVLNGATWLETPNDASSLVTRHYFNTWPPGAISRIVEVSIRPAIEQKEENVPEPVSDELIAYRLGETSVVNSRRILKIWIFTLCSHDRFSLFLIENLS